MSRTRLVSSYASMSAALAGAAWVCVVLFPLRGMPQVVREPAQQQRVAGQIVPRGAVLSDSPGITVNTQGTILHRAGVRYPAEAMRVRVEGIVVLELTLDAQGNVTDARAVSGPEQFRKSALESALQWHYAPNTSSPIQATIDFRLPPVPPPAPPPRTEETTSRGVIERIDMSALPQPVRDLLEPRVAPFIGRPFSPTLMGEILEKVREVEPHITSGVMFQSDRQAATITLRLPGSAAPVPPQPTFEPPPDGTERVRIGGAIQSEKITNRVIPEYPALARQARIQGTVRFGVVIAADGTVKNLQLVSGHPLLVQSAYDAVKQWTYQPTLLNGNPVEVMTTVDVNFTLTQ